MNETLRAAYWWLGQGASILPIRYRDKRPDALALRMTGYLAADGHASWGALQTLAPTWERAATWFDNERQLNLGVVTGYNGLVVLDFDTLQLYDSWMHLAIALGDKMADVALHSYRVFTSRGVHVYVHVAEPVKGFKALGQVDVKSSGGYVLAPPSIHPSGCVYQSKGDTILSVESLQDVFPFEPDIKPPLRSTVRPTPADAVPTSGSPYAGRSIIERIKKRYSVADLLGLDLAGRRYVVVHCPLHDDRNPSLIVYADGRCQCMAGCNGGKQMDVIDLYQALHGVELSEALYDLAGMVGL